MGLFGDLDVASAAEISSTYDEGTWPFVVSDVKVAPSSKGTMTGMTLTCTFSDGKYTGKKFVKWDRVPQPGVDLDIQTPEQVEKSKSYLKANMLALGIPQEQINDVNPQDLIGLEGFVRVTKRRNNKSGQEENVYYFQKHPSSIPTGTGAFS